MALPLTLPKSIGSLIYYIFVLALVILQIVALATFVGPLFKAKKQSDGKYAVKLTSSNNDLQRAFTVVFWLTVLLSIIGPIITHKAAGPKAATFIGALIFLALTVLCWVGVGFLTAQTWKKDNEGDDGKATLTFKENQWYVLKITTILLLIVYALPIAFLVVAVLEGLTMRRGPLVQST